MLEIETEIQEIEEMEEIETELSTKTNNPLQTRQKIISALGGAFVTSLLTTPFDVVKIRIQSGTHLSSGTINGMIKIASSNGILSLWKGLLPTLFMAVPSSVIYYIGYEHLRDSITPILPAKMEIYSPLLAGSIARTISAILVSPIELLKTRMQSSVNETEIKMFIKCVNHSNGIGFLWRGLMPTLWRDVPFSAIYWFAFEEIKKPLILQFQNYNLVNFTAGCISGTIAAILTQPFDVAKTLQQTTAPDSQSSSMRNTFKTLIRNDGYIGLFKGMSPRIAKVAPACGIMIASYELGKAIFENRNNNII